MASGVRPELGQQLAHARGGAPRESRSSVSRMASRFCSTVRPRKIDGLLRQVADAAPGADVHRIVGHVGAVEQHPARSPATPSPTTIENVVVLPAPFGPSRPDDLA